MPRNPKRKTLIGNFPEALMRDAVGRVLQGEPLRAVARSTKLSLCTLSRYVKKQRLAPERHIRMCPNYGVNKIFTTEQENALEEYIIHCANMMYGLTNIDLRKLAYEMAARNALKYPAKWDELGMAGKEWTYGFMRRHPRLSLRSPEGCSMARAVSFNRSNVDKFFDLLQDAMQRHPQFADGARVFNLDETGTMTVQKSAKVIAPKGQKQVSKVTSGERGTLVTTCVIVSATGNDVPPAMIFPRVNFRQHMLVGAPPGTLGLANLSGWMTRELFPEVLAHFIKHTNSSKSNPTLLIYDNHESHLSIEVLNMAKENGVTILTIPPHCSNKLQPLDVGVFRSFSSFYNAAIDSLLMRQPGRPMIIYNVAECVGVAYKKSITRENITAAFKKSGIFPYDRHVFTDTDFQPSMVSDRPNPSGIQEEQHSIASAADKEKTTSAATMTESTNIADEPVPQEMQLGELKVSQAISVKLETCSPGSFVKPSEIRAYPRRKSTVGKRRTKGKCMIATDTPEKNELEAKQTKKNRAQSKGGCAKKKIAIKQEPKDEPAKQDKQKRGRAKAGSAKKKKTTIKQESGELEG